MPLTGSVTFNGDDRMATMTGHQARTPERVERLDPLAVSALAVALTVVL